MKRGKPLARRTPLRARTELRRTGFALVAAAEVRVHETRISVPRPRRETGFPASVRLAARKRAGGGDPGRAICEGCGTWLGRYGGDVQHIFARGMGGSRRRNAITNAVLLCSPANDLRTCHGRCEARDEHYRAMGFWRKSSDPRVPIMLHGEQSGVLVWLTPEGGYKVARPGEEAA